MSFDWAEFLTLADALLRNPDSPGPEEASLRSAISRAYYAAFCSARNLARDRREITPTGSARDHLLVKKHFEASPDRTRRKIGINLGRLRNYRNMADYRDSLSRATPMAQSSVALARNVHNALTSL
jgi:uncharacterized protein (UPF0332 family)